ncbi:transporter substrate-binding domain-containing protein, partial [Desulfococcaceae bacterium HSG9]|nr:transporter substrate-binding domain-containing protein [Desulfococcaceae bacterium HSG9]
NYYALCRFTLTVLIISVFLTPSGYAEQTLKQVWSNFPPFTIAENPDSPGFSYELVREMHRYSGLPFNPELFPWKRAQIYTQEQEMYLIFSIARTENREPLYTWISKLISIDFGFVMAPKISWTITSFEDAKKLTSIGVVDGTPQHRMLVEQGFTNLDVVVNEEFNAKKLVHGRIDAWYGPIHRAFYLLKESNVKEKPKVSKAFTTVDSYLAGNLNVSKKVVTKLQAAFEQMKSDGTYDRIYNKYFEF